MQAGACMHNDELKTHKLTCLRASVCGHVCKTVCILVQLYRVHIFADAVLMLMRVRARARVCVCVCVFVCVCVCYKAGGP